MGSLEGISEKDEDYLRSEEQQEEKNDDLLRNMLDFKNDEKELMYASEFNKNLN